MFDGFHDKDFDVFAVPGLTERMDALKAHVRPKLEELGKYFAEFLAPRVGEEIFAHVAKHARRTINPPDDTWVAFSTNARGYKQHPHFQIGLWQTHAFVTFGYIYEATGKVAFGQQLQHEAAQIHRQLPGDFVWIPDHTSPESIPASEVGVPEIERFAKRLREVKRAELLVGARFDRTEVTAWTGSEFVTRTEAVMEQLLPLYRLTTANSLA